MPDQSCAATAWQSSLEGISNDGVPVVPPIFSLTATPSCSYYSYSHTLVIPLRKIRSMERWYDGTDNRQTHLSSRSRWNDIRDICVLEMLNERRIKITVTFIPRGQISSSKCHYINNRRTVTTKKRGTTWLCKRTPWRREVRVHATMKAAQLVQHFFLFFLISFSTDALPLAASTECISISRPPTSRNIVISTRTFVTIRGSPRLLHRRSVYSKIHRRETWSGE